MPAADADGSTGAVTGSLASAQADDGRRAGFSLYSARLSATITCRQMISITAEHAVFSALSPRMEEGLGRGGKQRIRLRVIGHDCVHGGSCGNAACKGIHDPEVPDAWTGGVENGTC